MGKRAKIGEQRRTSIQGREVLCLDKVLEDGQRGQKSQKFRDVFYESSLTWRNGTIVCEKKATVMRVKTETIRVKVSM